MSEQARVDMFSAIDPPLCYWGFGQAMDAAWRVGYQRGYERGFSQGGLEVAVQQPRTFVKTKTIVKTKTVIVGFDRERWEKFKTSLAEHAANKAGVLVNVYTAQQVFCKAVDDFISAVPED